MFFKQSEFKKTVTMEEIRSMTQCQSKLGRYIIPVQNKICWESEKTNKILVRDQETAQRTSVQASPGRP